MPSTEIELFGIYDPFLPLEPTTATLPIPCVRRSTEPADETAREGEHKLSDDSDVMTESEPAEEETAEEPSADQSTVTLDGPVDFVREDSAGAGDSEQTERSEQTEDSVEIVGRGWVVPPGGSRVDALFMISGQQLGVARSESTEGPVWVALDNIVSLDAIGEPVDELTEVEFSTKDGTTVSAGWTDAFCQAVVEALRSTVDEAVEGPAADVVEADLAETDVAETDVVEADVVEADLAETADDPPTATDHSPESVIDDDAALASDEEAAPITDGAAESASEEDAAAHDHTPAPTAVLELEDVTYIGGFPGESRKRKRCTATLSAEGVEVDGPSEMKVRLAWDSVQSVEAQNSDEARFRTNTKIHPDSSALVFECDDNVTVVLEARDCPTIPLRQAIGTLLEGIDVAVR